jgi:uncharacterized RDD family membrane protein YckC
MMGHIALAIFHLPSPSLQIRTPEGIAFSLPLAGPIARALAWGVDVICLTACVVILSFALSALGVLAPDLIQAVAALGIFVLQIGYGIVTEWRWRGRTFGKRVMRLRVVDVHGLKLQFSQVVIRNLLRAVDFLPAFYLVGGLTAVLSRRGQRLGDLAANTIVVRVPQIEEPDLDQLLAGKYNSLRAHPHLAARLRQRTSPAEAALALQALVRRDELDDTPRVELFADLAVHFRKVVEFPPDATEGITDEQYVRNVVDVLYRQKGA